MSDDYFLCLYFSLYECIQTFATLLDKIFSLGLWRNWLMLYLETLLKIVWLDTSGEKNWRKVDHQNTW